MIEDQSREEEQRQHKAQTNSGKNPKCRRGERNGSNKREKPGARQHGDDNVERKESSKTRNHNPRRAGRGRNRETQGQTEKKEKSNAERNGEEKIQAKRNGKELRKSCDPGIAIAQPEGHKEIDERYKSVEAAGKVHSRRGNDRHDRRRDATDVKQQTDQQSERSRSKRMNNNRRGIDEQVDVMESECSKAKGRTNSNGKLEKGNGRKKSGQRQSDRRPQKAWDLIVEKEGHTGSTTASTK